MLVTVKNYTLEWKEKKWISECKMMVSSDHKALHGGTTRSIKHKSVDRISAYISNVCSKDKQLVPLKINVRIKRGCKI